MTHDEKIVEAVARVLDPSAWKVLDHAKAAELHKTMIEAAERFVQPSISDARAAITAYQAEAWQGIETAPKERGAKILGWCVFPAGAEVRLCQNAPAYTSAPGATSWYAHGMTQQVTHWQPLPPAPKATP